MTKCPKCGSTTIVGPRYCSGAMPCPCSPVPNPFLPPGMAHHGEHLYHHCICGYAVAKPCLDHKESS